MNRFMPESIRRFFNSPASELNRWQYAVRYLVEVCRHGVRRLREDRAGQMAGALAFRTLFGLIPVLALGMVLFHAFGGADKFEQVVRQVAQAANLPEVMIPNPDAAEAEKAEADAASEGMGDARSVDEGDGDSDGEQASEHQSNMPDAIGEVVEPDSTEAMNLRSESNSEENAESTGQKEAEREETDAPGSGNAATELNTNLQSQQTEGNESVGEDSDDDQNGKSNSTTNGKKPTAGEQSLVDFVLSFIQKIEANVSFKSIGAAGILLLIWAAIGLLTTIERSFNTICRAPENRSLVRRVPLYWIIITIGPALVYLSFALEERVSTWMESMFGWLISGAILGEIISFATTWLLLFLLYSFTPTTRLPIRAVAIGAFISAILWFIGANLLTGYLATAFGGGNANFSILYGSLGLIPVFMIWVYVMWLIVLFGLEVASTLQAVGGHILDQREIPDRPALPPLMDASAIVPVVQSIAQHFKAGQAASNTQIAEESQCNERAVEIMIAALVEYGLVHEVARGESDEKRWALARPAEAIHLDEVVRIGQRLIAPGQPDDRPVWRVLEKIQEAQREAVARSTLAEI